MSRVHEALRKAGMLGAQPAGNASSTTGTSPLIIAPSEPAPLRIRLEELEGSVKEFDFRPGPGSHLMTLTGELSTDAPYEEFRSLRTRLNHIQKQQPLRSLVVTSPSPAEGKSFTASNLAIAEAQLAGQVVLLADFDLRRPVLHDLFGIPRAPGLADYLQGQAELEQILWRAKGSNLYVLPAGRPVINPLELLNLPRAKQLIDAAADAFTWVIMDTPPLLFAADGSLLNAYAHGTLLIVRLGQTTLDALNRALQTLCENNVVGVIVNGAQRRELYSRYTYYARYYSTGAEESSPAVQPADSQTQQTDK